MSLFHTVLYRPLFNLLVWLDSVIPGHDIGLAIIALTIVIRLILWPLSQRALESQKALQRLQPELEAMRAAHKSDPERQAKEMMALYAREKVHPLSSCLPVLIQLPIFIALYQVLRVGLTGTGYGDLYAFVPKPEHFSDLFIGFVPLAVPSAAFALLAGVAQYFQARQLTQLRPPTPVREGAGEDEDMATIMNKQMMYVMPVVTVLVSWSLPAGLALYWFVSTLLQILQQYLAFRSVPATVRHVDPS